MKSLGTLGKSVGVAFAGFACLSCEQPPVIDLNSLRQPVTDIAIYTSSVVEVGDTARVEAEGFYHGQGGAQLPQTVTFSVADSTVVSFENTNWTAIDRPAKVARGLRTGLTSIVVTINGVSASDTLRVIPRIGSIIVTPAAATIHINDTISFRVNVVAVDGSEITTVHPFTFSSVPGIAQGSGRDLYHALKPGTVAITATVRRTTGTATLTVLP